MSKAVVVISGGMDSVTLAYQMKAQGYDLLLISFDYGQRHYKELDSAILCAQALGVEHAVIDISGVGHWLKGSALTDDIDVPDGHYADETMRVTVVPNRNAIMLSVAVGIAVGHGVSMVATAVHAGDHPIYPDCRPEFIVAFEQMARLATGEQIVIHAPFVHLSKADIVGIGAGVGVPYERTWSCYKGGKVHCGTCGTCVERKEAFVLAGVLDPTVYAVADTRVK